LEIGVVVMVYLLGSILHLDHDTVVPFVVSDIIVVNWYCSVHGDIASFNQYFVQVAVLVDAAAAVVGDAATVPHLPLHPIGGIKIDNIPARCANGIRKIQKIVSKGYSLVTVGRHISVGVIQIFRRLISVV
jgi:hypothetical protein